MGLILDFLSELLSDSARKKADKAVLTEQGRKVRKFAAEHGLYFAPGDGGAAWAAPALGELGGLGFPAAPEQVIDVVSGTLRGRPVLGFDNPRVHLRPLDSGHFWFAAARLPRAFPDVVARSPWEVRNAGSTPATGWFPDASHYAQVPGTGAKQAVLGTDPGFAAHVAGGVRGRGAFGASWAIRGRWAVTWDPGLLTAKRLQNRFGLVCDLADRCG